MGFLQDTTVEVTYNGKTTRVAKEDAHLYEAKESKAKKEAKNKE
jgi:ribosomal 50S subunit-recycling heat shock protein